VQVFFLESINLGGQKKDTSIRPSSVNAEFQLMYFTQETEIFKVDPPNGGAIRERRNLFKKYCL